MAINIVLPDTYGYVALAACSMVWLNWMQANVVGSKRKAAKIPYPQMYADKAQQEASKEALAFNCAQRAHGNTLEYLPTTLFTLLFTGLRYPMFAACTGAAVTAGRILYTIGYISGGPSGRYGLGGGVALVGSLALFVGSTWSAIQMVM
ncbi:hypothetical protein M407DRAFT_242577 [Tulasnella calospora MUT 4182]|uniref:Membrane-associated proteins in eicosanoid and glutathione metabolism n=1 Tax=Tulasnella calospora MUT 4182 TaxID=1051891 RepID=A0A0C3QPW5_9AGAM|nr:hypothetical protein M407DRAFT_242577 [Tulasnella calospora MUT 4182]